MDSNLVPRIRCKIPYPTYFISHGAPTIIQETNDNLATLEAIKSLKTIGSTITNDLKPDYIIVVSAHYQSSSRNLIEISINKDTDHENKLVYDFYGFDRSFYTQKFESRSNVMVGCMLYDQLKKNGFEAKIFDRGIDHGVWCPLKVMFGEKLDIPLIQVSLPYSEDFDESYKLGKTLKFFRDNLIWDETSKSDLKGLVIASGSSVHNLRDFRLYSSNNRLPYVDKFHKLIDETFQKSSPLTILENLKNFKKDSNYKQLLYQAHPTLEHFLPLVVAAGTDDGKNEFNKISSSGVLALGYGYYQFGTWDEPKKQEV
ncbi:hypothetical protein CLIB1444_07S05600 [[Candida] jaroonii]|uniref:Uncharacterized protein n=1 Tax=[Candida] jaroonii TaxID=467808 RepID=A0ACA9YAV6_9ASCO|nr:hypothetical protein CLIB1444_07S05600 [[Candida] jaroonii]